MPLYHRKLSFQPLLCLALLKVVVRKQKYKMKWNKREKGVEGNFIQVEDKKILLKLFDNDNERWVLLFFYELPINYSLSPSLHFLQSQIRLPPNSQKIQFSNQNHRHQDE